MTRSEAGGSLCGPGGDSDVHAIRTIVIFSGHLHWLCSAPVNTAVPRSGADVGRAGCPSGAATAVSTRRRRRSGFEFRTLPSAPGIENIAPRGATRRVWKPRLRPPARTAALPWQGRLQGRYRTACVADDVRRGKQPPVPDGFASESPRDLPGPHQDHPRPWLPPRVRLRGESRTSRLTGVQRRGVGPAQQGPSSVLLLVGSGLEFDADSPP